MGKFVALARDVGAVLGKLCVPYEQRLFERVDAEPRFEEFVALSKARVVLLKIEEVGLGLLAKTDVHKAAALCGSFLDEFELVGRKVDDVEHAQDLAHLVSGHAVDREPLFALGIDDEAHLVAAVLLDHLDARRRPVRAPTYHLFVVLCARRLAYRAAIETFGKISLAAGVLALKDVETLFEGHRLRRVVAKIRQCHLAYTHRYIINQNLSGVNLLSFERTQKMIDKTVTLL